MQVANKKPRADTLGSTHRNPRSQPQTKLSRSEVLQHKGFKVPGEVTEVPGFRHTDVAGATDTTNAMVPSAAVILRTDVSTIILVPGAMLHAT